MTRIGDDAQIEKIKEMIAIRHLKVVETIDTIIGTDGDEVFFRALKTGPNSWLCTYTDTKVVKWK